jgi:hypothetical protein
MRRRRCDLIGLINDHGAKAVAPTLAFILVLPPATLMLTASTGACVLREHLRDILIDPTGPAGDARYDRTAPSMRRNVMTTPVTSQDFRKKAAEFERIAEQAIGVEHRDTMRYLATRWHALADDVEAEEKRS